MNAETRLPLTGSAFEHPGTQHAWQRARRWVLLRTALWVVGALAVLLVLGAVAGASDADSGVSKLVTAVVSLLLVFVFLPGLLIGVGSLLRLRGIKSCGCTRGRSGPPFVGWTT